MDEEKLKPELWKCHSNNEKLCASYSAEIKINQAMFKSRSEATNSSIDNSRIRFLGKLREQRDNSMLLCCKYFIINITANVHLKQLLCKLIVTMYCKVDNSQKKKKEKNGD